jgi:hypothetical protein
VCGGAKNEKKAMEKKQTLQSGKMKMQFMISSAKNKSRSWHRE